MDYKFASFCSFSSFNSTRKAVKLLSALDNVKNDSKRLALIMNHISESIIRGVFSEKCQVYRNLDVSFDASVILSFSFVKRCNISQRFLRLFRLVVIYTCYLCCVVLLAKKSQWKFGCISILWRLLPCPLSDVFDSLFYFLF